MWVAASTTTTYPWCSSPAHTEAEMDSVHSDIDSSWECSSQSSSEEENWLVLSSFTLSCTILICTVLVILYTISLKYINFCHCYNYYRDIEDEEQTSVASERKFIVFESCLRSLLSVCLICQTACEVTVRNCVGTMVTFKSTCTNGHQRLWTSQPCSGNMPWGNLVCAAGILFTGCNPYKAFNYFRNIGVHFIAPRTYNLLQQLYIVPCVSKIWEKHQIALLHNLQQKQLVLGGDGRCDSPGYSAKYGSYSLMELENNKVIDVQPAINPCSPLPISNMSISTESKECLCVSFRYFLKKY